MSTISNFECFNACIKSAGCIYALRVYSKSSDNNCYLKSTTNQSAQLNIDQDSEAIVLTGEYKYWLFTTKLNYIKEILILNKTILIQHL